MGTWGFKVYQNDTALDIKDEFEKLFNAGKAIQQITDELIEDYKNIMGDPDEEPLFWLALADTQWNFGVFIKIKTFSSFAFISTTLTVLRSACNTAQKACPRASSIPSGLSGTCREILLPSIMKAEPRYTPISMMHGATARLRQSAVSDPIFMHSIIPLPQKPSDLDLAFILNRHLSKIH